MNNSEECNNHYVHVKQSTYEEQVELYSTLENKVLIDMLIECNKQLETLAYKPAVQQENEKVCGNCKFWLKHNNNQQVIAGLCQLSKIRNNRMISACGLRTSFNFSCNEHIEKTPLKQQNT